MLNQSGIHESAWQLVSCVASEPTAATVSILGNMNGSNSLSAIVSTCVIQSLEFSDDDALSPEKIVKYCDQALQVIAADEELHRATRILNTMANSVKRTLRIFLNKRKNLAFELPPELRDLDLKDKKNGDDNWKKIKEWETEWLQQLRAAVAQDTVQTVLDAVSEINLNAVPGAVLSAKQVLMYVGRVARLIDGLSESTVNAIKNKALNSALMRKWPATLRHLMEDTAKVDENWEDLLERLSDFCTNAHNYVPIIRALTMPVPTPSNSAKKRLALEMHAPNPKPIKSPRREDQPESEIDEAERTRIEERDAKFEDITGICRDCNSEFTWTAGEQGFYEDKGFSEGPKSCLDCRRKAKKLARQAEAAQKSAKPSSGWGNKSGPDSSSGWGKKT